MKLPQSVRELAAVIGHEQALYLVGQLPQCYAGKDGKKSNRVMLYVPTLDRLKVSHQLVRILGWQDAVRLCDAFGGEILQPANCSVLYREYRDAAIVRLVHVDHVPVAMVAQWFGVSDRHVRNVLMENPPKECITANDNNQRSSNETKEARLWTAKKR